MRNRNRIQILILMTATLLWSEPTWAQPQPATPPAPASPGKVDKPAGPGPAAGHPVQPYRLDFSLNELEGGRKTNSRHYSMDLTAGSPNEIKIGTRVPVQTAKAQPGAPANAFTSEWQYMDVGTSIWASLRESKDESEDWQLEVRSDVSDIDKGAGNDLAPIVRQMKFNGTTLLVTGRPMIIATMDDPNSNRQFQLEVTATKLR